MEFQLTFRLRYPVKTAGENFLHTFPEFNTEATSGGMRNVNVGNYISRVCVCVRVELTCLQSPLCEFSM